MLLITQLLTYFPAFSPGDGSADTLCCCRAPPELLEAWIICSDTFPASELGFQEADLGNSPFLAAVSLGNGPFRAAAASHIAPESFQPAAVQSWF